MKESFLEKAELHYEKHEFKEALDILYNVWRFDKSEKVGFLILSSLRQMFHFKSAKKWIDRLDEHFPKSELIQGEKLAIEYETDIRPALQHGNLEEAIDQIAPLLAKISDKEFVKRVIFSVIRKAKDDNAWSIANEWLDKLNVNKLSKKQREVSGKKRISEKQRYYLSKYDVLHELGEFESLLEVLQHAQEDFPDIKLFQKQYQDTLFQLKRYDDILTIFETEMNWKHPNWGLVETASEAHFLKEDYEKAWRLACMAFNSHGSQKVKIDLHLLISQIAEKLGKNELAHDFKTLTVLVRAENKLEVTHELMEHVKTIKDHSITAKDIIQKYENEIIDGMYIGKPRYEGKVVWFPLDKNFAKIKYADSEKTIIIFKDNIDHDCHYEGAKITFIEDRNIDPKTGEEKEIARAGRRKVKLVTA